VSVIFPSAEWFQEAADRLNASDSFQRLGSCDAAIGVQVDDRCFSITFDAFAITKVAEVPCEAPGDLDFVLLQTREAWQAMLNNIKANGAAEALFTLNSLDLQTPEGLATGEDYTRRDLFYRYNQTFQDYFDISAEMETTFA
tara:strand:+ start:166 stop:591 length:426 start_codon:yes stop_codon:yes gene_type:complete